MAALISLNKLKTNETGVIRTIDENAPNKLYDFDFLENQEITLLQKSPFRGPIIFKVGAIKVAIRYADACLIWVDQK